MYRGVFMLIIVGSRREGNSYYLAKKVKEALDRERITSSIIVPGNQTIHVCTGCMDCDQSGKCDFTDDMEDNIEKIKDEEILMFITPTRWNLLSGDLKIFIDRLNPLYSSRGLKNKKVIIVSIGAKGKEVYSTESSTSSLRSFAESSLMKVVLTKDFNDCLDASDLSQNKSLEVENFIEEVKNIVKEN